MLRDVDRNLTVYEFLLDINGFDALTASIVQLPSFATAQEAISAPPTEPASPAGVHGDILSFSEGFMAG